MLNGTWNILRARTEITAEIAVSSQSGSPTISTWYCANSAADISSHWAPLRTVTVKLADAALLSSLGIPPRQRARLGNSAPLNDVLYQRLLRLINGERLESTRIELATELIVRESTVRL